MMMMMMMMMLMLCCRQVWDEKGANLLYMWKLPRSQPANCWQQHAMVQQARLLQQR
jgi:hypothetical protein